MKRRSENRATRLIAQVPIPTPWDVEQLCANVARVVGRPVRLVNRKPTDGDRIYATVLSGSDGYYVFVREDLRGVHRDQAVCHELGHLLAGHLTDVRHEPVANHAISFLPSLSPALIARVRHRACCYDDEREREAEQIGTALLSRGREGSHGPGNSVARGFGEALQ